MIHNTSAECLPITIYTCKHGLVLFHFVENMLGGIQLNWALRFVFRESYHPSELNYRTKFPFYLVYIYLIIQRVKGHFSTHLKYIYINKKRSTLLKKSTANFARTLLPAIGPRAQAIYQSIVRFCVLFVRKRRSFKPLAVPFVVCLI